MTSAAAVPAVKRLILLRHGQTEYNASDRMQGQLDTDLSDLGRAQAKTAAQALADKRPFAIVSSDLRRAHDTALALGDHIGLPVETDARLRETHLGDWQGLTHTDVDVISPGARARWRTDAEWAPPAGESRIDVAARSLPVVLDQLERYESWGSDPLVLVAHGGLIAALTARLLDLPVDRWPVLGGLGNTSWVQLSGHGEGTDPVWRLDVWNASASVASDVL
ncbi:histidine phosphatase family protein [Rhodococcus sp. AG1013]|uniref:histidine phosphatase family protein n=1 Tax=unclassified Rhodococcus (in: high G+C Gram-positive bacteria) TaxID=192944 RepID=UPI000E0B88E7|nr:histidine phosphatase family protein [Rhodococcus sp. AG1013]RDI32332.1 glucosyl-3-phosphoglycerate phosphatase (pgm family) [Rhodococcus sp. AG1013]